MCDKTSLCPLARLQGRKGRAVRPRKCSPITTRGTRNRTKDLRLSLPKPSPKESGSRSKSPLTEPGRPTDSSKTGLASESESSSGSGGTITHISPMKRDNSGRTTTNKQRRHPINKPDALSFLDSDSPQVTPESIERTVQEATKSSPDSAKSTSPSTHSTSSTSSGFRDDVSDAFVDHETDRSTSPERSIDGDPRGRSSAEADIRMKTGKNRKRSYGTPEMPRGNVQHPHISPEVLTPRVSNQHFAKHLPRAEKLPLTGYELLASRLSATSPDRGGPCLRPMYRKFELLNHRLLLHLQDEICELEEQLHRLDTADTQNRRLQNCILPASRRAESVSGGELQWHKTDILGKIGFKLEQYNRVLSSFRETQFLPTPTLADIHEYQGYLSTYAPIAEIETRFLDAVDDLVCIGDGDEGVEAEEEEMATPMPPSGFTDFQPQRRVSIPVSIRSQSDISRRHDERSAVSQDQVVIKEKPSLIHISLAMAVAVILPILTFMVIPGFIGRMTVVSLVGAGTLGALVQGRVIGVQATQDFCVCVGLYGGVMAILAGMVS
ncbi:hypothetical protein F5Y19DRAFT_465968 [Xylariaceae sp. FL1651]|nr:hypothetical protein F5Y19DRAFT_465968 [Xylariaceae sp. FL1651]